MGSSTFAGSLRRPLLIFKLCPYASLAVYYNIIAAAELKDGLIQGHTSVSCHVQRSEVWLLPPWA